MSLRLFELKLLPSIDFHAKIMREFHFDERGMPPEQTARLDKAYKSIKEVIGHRFTNTYKSGSLI